jgi:hypothetical protein
VEHAHLTAGFLVARANLVAYPGELPAYPGELPAHLGQLPAHFGEFPPQGDNLRLDCSDAFRQLT